jgi:hypothetical protein
MFLTKPLELAIDNQAGCNDDPICRVDRIARRTPILTSIAEIVASLWRKVTVSISRNMAAERRNRAAIERELFCGQYTLSSKNDDDLPVVR